MNEYLRYYQKRFMDFLLYVRHMPDISIRTSIFAFIIVVGITGYLLGGMSVRSDLERDEVAVVGALPFAPYPTSTLEVDHEELKDGAFVAGKTSGVYYAKSCKGWSRIASKNRVWFASVHAAEDAGYSRSKNCK